MKKTINESGITLIALIITIIIMIILVGVSINVAINGGLFGTTREAALETRAAEVDERATEWKAIKEMDKYYGTTTAQTLKSLLNDLENQKLLTSKEKEDVIVTGKVTIGSRTIVFVDFSKSDDLDLLERYFLGENKLGKAIDSLLDQEKMTGDIIVFKNDPDTIEDANTSLIYIKQGQIDSNMNEFYVDVRYKGRVYRVTCEGKEIIDDNGDSNEVMMTKRVELVFDLPQGTSDKELLAAYFSTKSLQDIYNILGLNGEAGFTDDPYTIKDASSSITFIEGTEEISSLGLFGNPDCLLLYTKYNNKPYIVNYKGEYNAVAIPYEKQGREGEIVKYDGDNDGTKEDWMILYDNGDNVEIISMKTMGILTLGYDDKKAQGETNEEKAIYSYNNAIERINKYCETLITNPSAISVRSVGSNPSDKFTENTKLHTSSNLASWHNGKYNGMLNSGDTNYSQDFMRMICNDSAHIGETYWLSSRATVALFEESFSMSAIKSDNTFTAETLLSIGRDKENDSPLQLWVGVSASSKTNPVRPIVKVSKDSIN